MGQALLFPCQDTGVPATHSHSGQDPSHEENGFRKAPHWGFGGFAGTLRDAGTSRTQKLPIPNHYLLRSSGPGPSHTTEVLVFSRVSSCLSRGLTLVQLGKMPNHLAFDTKISLKKNSRERQAMLVFHPALLLCFSLPGRMLGNWEAVFAARL